jgi:hypothetical protein
VVGPGSVVVDVVVAVAFVATNHLNIKIVID